MRDSFGVCGPGDFRSNEHKIVRVSAMPASPVRDPLLPSRKLTRGASSAAGAVGSRRLLLLGDSRGSTA